MIADINKALGNEGQSSEESDNDSGRLPNHSYALKITKPHYRHGAIGELMDDLDSSIDKLRSNTRSRHIHHRIRKRTTDRSERTVKIGLPKVIYDPHFFENLTPTMRAQVKARDTEMAQFSAYVSTEESNGMQQ